MKIEPSSATFLSEEQKEKKSEFISEQTIYKKRELKNEFSFALKVLMCAFKQTIELYYSLGFHSFRSECINLKCIIVEDSLENHQNLMNN